MHDWQHTATASCYRGIHACVIVFIWTYNRYLQQRGVSILDITSGEHHRFDNQDTRNTIAVDAYNYYLVEIARPLLATCSSTILSETYDADDSVAYGAIQT